MHRNSLWLKDVLFDSFIFIGSYKLTPLYGNIFQDYATAKNNPT